jgi:hypothetical protein
MELVLQRATKVADVGLLALRQENPQSQAASVQIERIRKRQTANATLWP